MSHRITCRAAAMILTVVTLISPTAHGADGGTFETEMVSMSLRGVAPMSTIDLADGAYRDREGYYVVVRNKRVVEKGNDARFIKSRTGHRMADDAPRDVKSGEKPQEAGLLLPAVQKVRAAASSRADDDCNVAWMKIEMKKVLVSSYSTGGAGMDALPSDGAYKVEGGGYAIVIRGKIVENGNNWRQYRPKTRGGKPCEPAAARQARDPDDNPRAGLPNLADK